MKKPLFEGFEENVVYSGRTFNNLYEISCAWASHKPTFLIEKKVFDQYFELINSDELVTKY
ncbi:MAG: hypothetical protein ACK4ND_01960 [Cytophagaceae bacterium]